MNDSEYYNRLRNRREVIRQSIRLLEQELDEIEAVIFPVDNTMLHTSAKATKSA